MKVGLIRVRTYENVDAADKHGPVIEKAFPGLEVKAYCIEDQHDGVYDEKTEAMATLKVIKLAKGLKGMEAIIVDCAADPGVTELKKELRIPVIGAGESLARVSRTLGNSIGALTITEGVPDVLSKELGQHLIGWRKVKGVRTGLDLELEASYRNSIEAAKELVKQGSNVIALACTGFATIGIASDMSRELGVPVVDPILAAGSMTYNLMVMRKSWK